MNTTIHTLHTIGRFPHDGATAPARPRPTALYAPVIHAVAGERLACTVLDRDDPTAAAEHRIGLAACLPLAPLVLLQRHRGFLDALSTIYGIDLTCGFERVACVRRLDVTRMFVADAEYRRAILNQVSRHALGTNGFIAVEPGHGMWRSTHRAGAVPGGSETLAICHLFGTCRFAQLCDDDVLERPVPVFLQPWSRERGLLPLERPPRELFSRTMTVHRLRPGRMILFDNE